MSETTQTTAGWDLVCTPIGDLVLVGAAGSLLEVRFPGGEEDLDPERREPRAVAEAAHQLGQYFAGERRRFDLELDLSGRGDDLARAVWAELRRVPYGMTVSYGELGARVGHDDPREIGSIVGSTPIPIVIPCHRVIGADGALRGYGGGLPRKEFLLHLEHGTSGATAVPVWARGEQLSLA